VSKVIAFLSLKQFIMVLMRRIFAALFPYLRKKVYFCILIAKMGDLFVMLSKAKYLIGLIKRFLTLAPAGVDRWFTSFKMTIL
jgi:hypothetical protein